VVTSSAVDRGFISGIIISVVASSAVDRGFISGIIVSVVTSSAVDRGFISGIIVSVVASSAVDRGFISGIIVSVVASSAVDRGFEPQSGQTKDYKIGIIKNKDWLAQNLVNVSKWSEIERVNTSSNMFDRSIKYWLSNLCLKHVDRSKV
jgi:hypothetical protein